MRNKTLTIITLILILSLSGTASVFTAEGGLLSSDDGKVSVSTSVELGFIGFFSHKIQFGNDGDYFDYVAEGGQDVLFPFQRISADITFGGRHTVTALIQPFDVRTNVILQNDLTVNTETFTAGTPMDLRYGFDFYRLSYLYDFWKSPDRELGVGLSLQLRDAVIDFASADGDQSVNNRNVGPVPIIKFRILQPVGDLFYLGSEIDGFYANITVLNGSLESEVTGLILDASLRAGIRPSDFFDMFLNLRYLGGGAEGTSATPTLPTYDGYNKNYLQAYSVTFGGRLR